MRQYSGLTAASKAIGKTLTDAELTSSLRPHMAKVKWADAVGERIARVTQAESVRALPDKNTYLLTVRVKNSVWANELSLLKQDILGKLNLALGGPVIGDIRFKASGLAKVTPAQEWSANGELPSPQDIAGYALPERDEILIAAKVANITNDRLRETVHRSLLHAARLTTWKHRHGWRVCERCQALLAPKHFADADQEHVVCSGCSPASAQ